MRVIAVASQKGGSGKTTLTGHLAVAAERAGLGPIAVIDCDPQGSLSDWWNARKAEVPLFVRSQVTALSADMERLREAGVKLILIDTPPAITAMIREVVQAADLVLIPIRPSPHDLRAAGATVDIVEHEGKPLVFVINAAPSRAKITGEAAVALSQHGTVAPVTIGQRTEFAASMTDGRTVLEIGGMSRSAEEILALWNYVHERLTRAERPAEADGAPVAVSEPTATPADLSLAEPAALEKERRASAPPPIPAFLRTGSD